MAKKKFRLGFGFWAFLYALVILTGAYFGLRYLWDFASAYEMARPYHAIDAYMEELTPDYVCQQASELIATVDHHIQSEDACKDVIRDAVSGGITYAKKTTECTDDRMVYILRTGNQVIGRVELEPRGETQMGYTPWAVSSDSYDFSYLLTDTVSVTVPAQFPVYVNGALLDESYVTEAGIRYTALEDFYEDYDLPTVVSYKAGPCLGEIAYTVADAQGNPVTVDETTDLNTFLHNCTPEEVVALTGFAEDFVRRYVAFSNSSAGESANNYYSVLKAVLPGSPLAKRCKEALIGMYYGVSQDYTIQSSTLNWCTKIGDGRYLCDITYVVEVTEKQVTTEQVFNIKIVVVVDTDDRLRAETLRNY